MVLSMPSNTDQEHEEEDACIFNCSYIEEQVKAEVSSEDSNLDYYYSSSPAYYYYQQQQYDEELDGRPSPTVPGAAADSNDGASKKDGHREHQQQEEEQEVQEYQEEDHYYYPQTVAHYFRHETIVQERELVKDDRTRPAAGRGGLAVDEETSNHAASPSTSNRFTNSAVTNNNTNRRRHPLTADEINFRLKWKTLMRGGPASGSSRSTSGRRGGPHGTTNAGSHRHTNTTKNSTITELLTIPETATMVDVDPSSNPESSGGEISETFTTRSFPRSPRPEDTISLLDCDLSTSQDDGDCNISADVSADASTAGMVAEQGQDNDPSY